MNQPAGIFGVPKALPVLNQHRGKQQTGFIPPYAGPSKRKEAIEPLAQVATLSFCWATSSAISPVIWGIVDTHK